MSGLHDKKPQPPSGIVTVLTDFGTADGFVAAMKGVILGVHPPARIIDLTHEVTPQNVTAGAFLLAAHFKYFPPGTVHMAVVDPGVGTARKAIACFAHQHYFVAPDNGLLDFCAEDDACVTVALTRREYWRKEVSNTFHGRDIFAPVAAHLSAGVPLLALGEPMQLTLRRPVPQCRMEGDTLAGEVVYVDHFGNLITNISQADLEAFIANHSFVIQLKKICLTDLKPSYGYARPGELVALINSFARLEIGLVQGNAQTSLAITVGTPLIIKRGS